MRCWLKQRTFNCEMSVRADMRWGTGSQGRLNIFEGSCLRIINIYLDENFVKYYSQDLIKHRSWMLKKYIVNTFFKSSLL